jgi:hypothetical protein
MNNTQKETLDKFKNKIVDEKLGIDLSVYDDAYLLRFLRARKFDLDKTWLMFTQFLNWRKEFGTDEIEVLYKD